MKVKNSDLRELDGELDKFFKQAELGEKQWTIWAVGTEEFASIHMKGQTIGVFMGLVCATARAIVDSGAVQEIPAKKLTKIMRRNILEEVDRILAAEAKANAM